MDHRLMCLISWNNGRGFGDFSWGGRRVAAGYRKVAARRARKRVKRSVLSEIEAGLDQWSDERHEV